MNIQLIEAARDGDYDKVYKLLKKGADVHADEDLAFREAFFYEHEDVADLLIQHGANIHARNEEALFDAIKWGRSRLVDYLLKKGANINLLDPKFLSYMDDIWGDNWEENAGANPFLK